MVDDASCLVDAIALTPHVTVHARDKTLPNTVLLELSFT